MQRDIDLIIERLKAGLPGIRVDQLIVAHAGDDDVIWFIRCPGKDGVVQIESPSGFQPFLIESEFDQDRWWCHSIEEVVSRVKILFAQVT